MHELTQKQQKLYQHPIYSEYACDESGNVYSKKISSRNKTGEYRKLKPAINRHGYLIFSICFQGKQINKQVHSFIFECFTNKSYQYSCKIGEGLTINHIDNNKLNNKFNNLELVTHRKNVQLQDGYKIENKVSGLPRFVYLDKRYLKKGGTNPYHVKIHYEGKLKHFGSFPNPELAVAVAKTKFQELFPNEDY